VSHNPSEISFVTLMISLLSL